MTIILATDGTPVTIRDTSGRIVWGGPPGRRAVWADKLDEWVSGTPPQIIASRTIGPEDDVAGALTALRSEALGNAARPLSPARHRARLILRPGTYAQRFLLNGYRADQGGIGIEVVGQTGDPSDVILTQADPALSVMEHVGVSALIAGVTLRSDGSGGTAWPIHGSGMSGVPHELVVHRCHIIRTDGVGQTFSHELGAGHILYVSSSTLSGFIYQHTIASTPALPTLAMWDDCVMDMWTAADESVADGDTLMVRSGSGARETWQTGYQRTGSRDNPKLRVILDPRAGYKSSSSPLVEFRIPRIRDHPILDENPIILSYWS